MPLDVLGRTRATLNRSTCSPFPRGTGKPLNPLLSNKVEKRGEDVGTRSSNLKSPHVLEEIPILSQLMSKNMNIEIKDDK